MLSIIVFLICLIKKNNSNQYEKSSSNNSTSKFIFKNYSKKELKEMKGKKKIK